MELISIIGSFLLACCGLPLFITVLKEKRTDISLPFLWMWFIGEILVAVYVIYKGEKALSVNYLSNILFILPVLYYRHFPRS